MSTLVITQHKQKQVIIITSAIERKFTMVSQNYSKLNLIPQFHSQLKASKYHTIDITGRTYSLLQKGV